MHFMVADEDGKGGLTRAELSKMLHLHAETPASEIKVLVEDIFKNAREGGPAAMRGDFDASDSIVGTEVTLEGFMLSVRAIPCVDQLLRCFRDQTSSSSVRLSNRAKTQGCQTRL